MAIPGQGRRPGSRLTSGQVRLRSVKGPKDNATSDPDLQVHLRQITQRKKQFLESAPGDG